MSYTRLLCSGALPCVSPAPTSGQAVTPGEGVSPWDEPRSHPGARGSVTSPGSKAVCRTVAAGGEFPACICKDGKQLLL